MKIESTAVIRAPRQEVFDVFSDIPGAANRLSGIRELKVLSKVTAGRGLRWQETRVLFGKAATEVMEMTDFDAPNAYVVEAESHGTHYTSRFAFDEQAPETTRVTWTFEGKPLNLMAKLMSPLGFLFKGTTRKMLDTDMNDLKRYIEGV